MKKSKLFWIVFIITTIVLFFIIYGLIRESFLGDAGRYLNYRDSKNIWNNEYHSTILGISIIISIVIGLIAGGLSTLFISKEQTSSEINDIKMNTSQQNAENKVINSKEFVEVLKKINKLLITKVYSVDEYNTRKDFIISELATKKINETPENFLVELIPLKEQSILSDQEIAKIKQLIS